MGLQQVGGFDVCAEIGGDELAVLASWLRRSRENISIWGVYKIFLGQRRKV